MAIGSVGLSLCAITAAVLKEPERGLQIRLALQKKKQQEAKEAAVKTDNVEVDVSSTDDEESVQLKIKNITPLSDKPDQAIDIKLIKKEKDTERKQK